MANKEYKRSKKHIRQERDKLKIDICGNKFIVDEKLAITLKKQMLLFEIEKYPSGVTIGDLMDRFKDIPMATIYYNLNKLKDYDLLLKIPFPNYHGKGTPIFWILTVRGREVVKELSNWGVRI